MLAQIVEGVLFHQSDFMLSNAVVVHGSQGVLLVDPGIREDEIACLANDIRESGNRVAAGFSTHPHWDHVLWTAELGAAPRYGTASGAAAIQGRLADPGWRGFVAGMIPPDIADQVPLNELFGRIAGLSEGVKRLPWHGPEIRLIAHQAHAPGHAALLIEERGVLVAGDMLSDVLVPILSPFGPDPIGDYLAALDLLEDAAGHADFVIPGHGTAGDARELRSRLDRDRIYIENLRDGHPSDDPRVGPAAQAGWEWVASLHEGQVQRLASQHGGAGS